MSDYWHFQPTSEEVRRGKKRVAQRKYREILRLRSEAAQLDDARGGVGQLASRSELDTRGFEAENCPSCALQEADRLNRVGRSCIAHSQTVFLQQIHHVDPSWCCPGKASDCTSSATYGCSQIEQESTAFTEGSSDLYAQRQFTKLSPPVPPLLPQSNDYQALVCGSVSTRGPADDLPAADDCTRLPRSSVHEINCSQVSPESTSLTHLSGCPQGAAGCNNCIGYPRPLLAGRTGVTALQDEAYGLDSPCKESTTTTPSSTNTDTGSGSQSNSQWDLSQLVRNPRAVEEAPATHLQNPDLTLHPREDHIASFSSIPVCVTDKASSSQVQGISPLFQAAMAGNLAILSFMVHNSVYPESVNQDGQTILHVAAGNGNFYAVEFLIGFGLNVNARDNMGNTALHLAIANGWEQVVKQLVDAGADVDGLN
ncbi:hypothetical protein E4U19_007585 [Claviceps sp. Clav32 group G5]|nr:hypothetical protein E4U19_007585 [Claviceps sp. Clav32 group G5]